MRALRLNRWLGLLMLAVTLCATPKLLACLPQGSDMVPTGDIDSFAELPGGG